jgi:predicted enzyme related to lactoylglutathione lyase
VEWISQQQPNLSFCRAACYEEGDKGVWMSVWVDDVDEMHKHCVAAGLEVTFPPTDMPWNVREMHLRHPDGHVFRVSRGFEPEK